MACTDWNAYWCPVHGDCDCARAEDGDCCFDNPRCPLHNTNSEHAQTIELASCEEQVRGVAVACGVSLSADDHAELSRFAQYLYTNSRLRRSRQGDK